MEKSGAEVLGGLMAVLLGGLVLFDPLLFGTMSNGQWFLRVLVSLVAIATALIGMAVVHDSQVPAASVMLALMLGLRSLIPATDPVTYYHLHRLEFAQVELIARGSSPFGSVLPPHLGYMAVGGRLQVERDGVFVERNDGLGVTHPIGYWFSTGSTAKPESPTCHRSRPIADGWWACNT